MLTIDQAQSKENGNKMKKLATKTNTTDPRCTSINQEGTKMYINYNDTKITEIHQTDAFYLKKKNYIENLEKTAAILDFQVAPRADLTSSPQRTFVPNLVLVSQFARLVPLSAPLKHHTCILKYTRLIKQTLDRSICPMFAINILVAMEMVT